MEIVYFELNNWSPGRDYPDVEPFISWMCDDMNQKFQNKEWVKENKLVVVESLVDMSSNYCITATKEWLEDNCPELLTKYSEFIKKSDEGDDLPEGRFGCPFLEYKENNIGIHFAEEVNNNGYLEYVIEDDD